jgi:phosphoserine phosphatase
MADQTRGPARQPPLALAGQKVAINICYEDVFGEELIRSLPEATLMLNLSNLAWYGDSLAQPQHLQIARLRALETGRPMLRATNTGMTAVVAPDGDGRGRAAGLRGRRAARPRRVEIPKAWYNIAADLPCRCRRCCIPAPAARRPGRPRAALPDVADHAGGVHRARDRDPEPVRDVYRQWRPSAAVPRPPPGEGAADAGEDLLQVRGREPAGSHKPNTAVPQAFYNKEAGIKRIVDRDRRRPVGLVARLRRRAVRHRGEVFMVGLLQPEAVPPRADGDLRRPLRRLARRTRPNSGRAILAKSPDTPAASASPSPRRSRSRRSATTPIRARQRAEPRAAAPDRHRASRRWKQMEMAGDYPDVVVGCTGGGSNFAGIAFPFLGEQLRGGKQGAHRRGRAGGLSQPHPRPLRLRLRRHRHLTPLVKMHTLGSTFMPPGFHAGGLRYHGMAPLVSHVKELGLIEAKAYHQTRSASRPARAVRARRHPAGARGEPRRARRDRRGAPLQGGGRPPHDPVQPVRPRPLRHAGLHGLLRPASLPADKQPALVMAPDTPLADRRNMAYTGTHVAAGQGHGLVIATGDATETGHIAGLIAAAPSLSTPLTRKMGVFARRLLIVILAFAALTFAIGVLRGESAYDMFMAAVALAVGAIPEGLPAAITITLAIGVARMARRRAIIRKLPAVETLGSTTVICSDKTGTLTENAMTVRALWAGGRRYPVSGQGYGLEGSVSLPEGISLDGALREALLAGVLCNDASLRRDGHHWRITGDPTEAALLVAARKAGLDETTLRAVFPRLDELPFDATRQSMATVHEIEGDRLIYVKGALERLLPACAGMLDGVGREAALARDAIEAEARDLARQGMRVLALAHARLAADQALGPERLERGLVFLGLAGMLDPPRAKAIAAVKACHAAGIRVKMITGDHPETALAIARQLGIAHGESLALAGRELAAMDGESLRRVARDVDVFARVEPEQKLRLVQALQANGEVVAMTGDGVNDAPALKQADIGVAMGLAGTEVAKEAADMVLTDDNFATIEAAVEEGRGLRQPGEVHHLDLPTNAGEGLVILFAVLAGVTLPITPLQILWINMTTAVLLGLPWPSSRPRRAS